MSSQLPVVELKDAPIGTGWTGIYDDIINDLKASPNIAYNVYNVDSTTGLREFQRTLEGSANNGVVRLSEVIDGINKIEPFELRQAVVQSLTGITGAENVAKFLGEDGKIGETEIEAFVKVLGDNHRDFFINGDSLLADIKESRTSQEQYEYGLYFDDALKTGNDAAIKQLADAGFITVERANQVIAKQNADFNSTLIDNVNVTLSPEQISAIISAPTSDATLGAELLDKQSAKLTEANILSILELGVPDGAGINNSLAQTLVQDKKIDLAQYPNVIQSLVSNGDIEVLKATLKEYSSILSPEQFSSLLKENDKDLTEAVLATYSGTVSKEQITTIAAFGDDTMAKLVNSGTIQLSEENYKEIVKVAGASVVVPLVQKSAYPDVVSDTMERLESDVKSGKGFDKDIANALLSSELINDNKILQVAIAAGEFDFVMSQKNTLVKGDKDTLEALYDHKDELSEDQRVQLYSRMLSGPYMGEGRGGTNAIPMLSNGEIKEVFNELMGGFSSSTVNEKYLLSRIVSDPKFGITIDDMAEALVHADKATKIAFTEELIKDGRFDVIATMVAKDPSVMNDIGSLEINEGNLTLDKIFTAEVGSSAASLLKFKTTTTYDPIAEAFDGDDVRLKLQELVNTGLLADADLSSKSAEVVNKFDNPNKLKVPGL